MKLAICGGLIAALSIGHIAQADVLKCLMDDADGGSWISDEYYLEYGGGSGDGQAYDAVTEHFTKGPVAASVDVTKGTKVIFSWTVFTTDTADQQSKMRYRAVYFLADNKVAVRATPGGYDNSFDARGHCTKQK